MRRLHLLTRLLTPLAIALSLTATASAQSRVIYVDHAATGANTGASWQDAFLHPRQALAVAAQGDELWVAQGTYGTSLTNDPADSIRITRAVRLYGGFDGTETARAQRDPQAHPTILSGSLTGGNAWNVVIVSHTDTAQARLDGFHVRDGRSMEGGGGMLIVTGGVLLDSCQFLDNYAETNGGAILVRPPMYELRISDCTFARNTAGASGGAIQHKQGMLEIVNSDFVDNASVAVNGSGRGGALHTEGMLIIRGGMFLRNAARSSGAVWAGSEDLSLLRGVRFEDNEANSVQDGIGGALDLDGNWRIEGCDFIGNTATGWGGAMILSTWGTYSLSECRFFDNEATTGGGAVVIGEHRDPVGGGLDIDRCQFARNRATAGTGGALWFGSWRLLMTNSLLVDNQATTGGAFYVDAPASSHSLVSNCTVVGNVSTSRRGAGYLVTNARFPVNQTRVLNSIFWDNRGPGGSMTEWDQLDAGATRVGFCVIQNHALRGGPGNFSADPIFRNPLAGDYRLLPGSPLVDAGYPYTGRVMPPRHNRDLEGEARLHGALVDIGADEVH